MANSVDPNETARNEPSHLDLHCLQRYLYWSVRIQWLALKGFVFLKNRHFIVQIRFNKLIYGIYTIIKCGT